MALKRAKVLIKTPGQLQKFLSRQGGGFPLGTQIRELRVRLEVKVREWDLERIQRMCPLLEVFLFEPDSLMSNRTRSTFWYSRHHRIKRVGYYRIFTGWRYLRRIPVIWKYSDEVMDYLHSHGHQLEKIVFSEDTMLVMIETIGYSKPFSWLTGVRKLVLDGHFYHFHFHPADMDELHAHMPQLEDLDMGGIRMTEEYQKEYQSASQPAWHLRRFAAKSIPSRPIWFDYIARKFPLLESLELLEGCDSDFSMTDSQQYKDGILEMAKKLGKLRQLIIESFFWLTLPFFEVLEGFGTQLTEFGTSIDFTDDRTKRTIEAYLPMIQSYVTSMALTLPAQFCQLPGSYTRLTKLEIFLCFMECDPDGLKLNVILDAAITLQELQIHGGSVYIESSQDDGKMHPLRKIGLSSVIFSDTFFSRLSNICLELKIVVLTSFLFDIPYLTRYPKFVVDTPHHTFDLVEVKDPSMAIFCMDIANCTTRESWYHVYVEDVEDENDRWENETAFNRKMQRLNDNDVAYIKKVEASCTSWIRPQRARTDRVPAKHWEKNVELGYFSLRCANIKSFVFDGVDYFQAIND
ncbi:hypothetical protein EC973_001082 [Apophysomyces ossiformis]|uniref:Uncharacterized protein n=1 Tax=Apophysomyces ossiformis TaxID=679940 RepID=A0A8H7BK40_9FUNG|nr:hypothetical protein EC973_001082 [Apophysomyces ossiformis]